MSKLSWPFTVRALTDSTQLDALFRSHVTINANIVTSKPQFISSNYVVK